MESLPDLFENSSSEVASPSTPQSLPKPDSSPLNASTLKVESGQHIESPADSGSVFEFEESYDNEPSVSSSGIASKILFSLMFVVMAGAIGGISYFGLGPMLAPPSSDVAYTNSSSPDVAEVLGLTKSQPILDDTLSTEEKQAYLDQLASLVQVPTNEAAAIYRMDSLPKAEKGSFFADAVVGDILIIFQDSGQAHLLRPSESKVVASGDLQAPAK